MVLLLSILGWSCWAGLSGQIDVQPAQKWWSGRGMSVDSPMAKLVSFLRQGKISIVDGFMIAYISSIELLGIYHG